MIDLPKTSGLGFIGIDTGTKGAICIVKFSSCKLLTKNLPDFYTGRKFDKYAYLQWLKEVITPGYNYIVTQELINAWGNITPEAAMNWGKAIGSIETGLASFGLRVGGRYPIAWKAFYRNRFEGVKSKQDFKQLAKELFPYWEDQITRVDIAEALLIGYCGYIETMEMKKECKQQA